MVMNTKWNTKVQRFRLMSLKINHGISWRNTLNCFVEDDEKDKRFCLLNKNDDDSTLNLIKTKMTSFCHQKRFDK